MSAPKAEAAGLTVERREELRRRWEQHGHRFGPYIEGDTPAVLASRAVCALPHLLDALAAAEAERDEARAAVADARVSALREAADDLCLDEHAWAGDYGTITWLKMRAKREADLAALVAVAETLGER